MDVSSPSHTFESLPDMRLKNHQALGLLKNGGDQEEVAQTRVEARSTRAWPKPGQQMVPLHGTFFPPPRCSMWLSVVFFRLFFRVPQPLVPSSGATKELVGLSFV